MIGDGSRTAVGYIKETTDIKTSNWGVTPATPELVALRHTGASLDTTTETAESNEIRADGQITDLATVGGGGAGSVDFELSYAEYNPFIEAALRSTFTETIFGSALVVSFVNATSTIQGTGIHSAGYVVGQIVRVFGSTSNNGDWEITAINAGELVVVAAYAGTATITDETPASDAVRVYGKVIRNGTTIPSFTFEQQMQDLTQFLVNTGMVVGTLGWNYQSKQILTGSMGMTGKQQTLVQATIDTSGVYTAASANPIMTASNNVANLVEGGAVVSGLYFKSVGFNIDNGLRTQDAVANVWNVGIGSGRFRVSGSISAYFNDETLYDKYAAGTESSMLMHAKDSSNNSIVVTMPRTKYAKASVDTGGNDSDVMQSLDYTALRYAAWNATVQIDLLTGTAPA